MIAEPGVPDAVLTLWHVTVVLALVVFVPLTIYLLHALYRAVRSTRNDTVERLAALRAIDAQMTAIEATNITIGVTTDVLTAAGAVASRLDTIATVLARRASKR